MRLTLLNTGANVIIQTFLQLTPASSLLFPNHLFPRLSEKNQSHFLIKQKIGMFSGNETFHTHPNAKEKAVLQ